MKIEITINQVLIFNDVPEIFTGKDSIGTKYIFLLINIENDIPEYLAVSISEKRFISFINKKLDLRTIFQNPEINLWYKTCSFSDETVTIQIFDEKEIREEYLPDVGFYLPFSESLLEQENKEIIAEANKYNNTIIHLSLSDENDRNDIDSNILSTFIEQFQSLIKNIFKKMLSEYKDTKINLDKEYNYKVKAFATSPGSFKLHLKSSSQLDLFSGAAIDIALKKIDDITLDIDNEDELIKKLQTIKGHSIQSYKKITQNIILKDIKFTYEWYSLSDTKVHKRTINKNQASKVNEILNAKLELSKEFKTFIGLVKQADVDKGNWRIYNNEDEKEYSGISITSEILKGVTIDTHIYEFRCEEIIEEDKVTGNERIKYKLYEINLN